MRSAIVTSALIGATLLIASGTARASEVLEFNVPFPFLVNHETFPAGHYTVEEGPLGNTSVLLIRGTNTPQATFVATHTASGQGPSHPTLQFERHENQYRLSSIWESSKEGQTIIQRK
jgi:hypothetical protein